MENKINVLAQILQDSRNAVFFGGAGVSTESGVPDFRSESGLYAAQEKYGYSPEEMLSRSFFRRRTELFFQYYKENLVHLDVKPNAAHEALAWLEANGPLKAIVTQNVDGLHQAAGSRNVIELHGGNARHYCMSCGQAQDLAYILDDANCDDLVPKCSKPDCGGIVRPDVVLYEEQLNEAVIDAALTAIEAADTLIIGGTSLVVYPAAAMIHHFRGKCIVLINKSDTGHEGHANLVINDSIGKVLGEVVKLL